MGYGLRDRDGVCELQNSIFAQALVAACEIRATFAGWIRDVSRRVEILRFDCGVSRMKMIDCQNLTTDAPFKRKINGLAS